MLPDAGVHARLPYGDGLYLLWRRKSQLRTSLGPLGPSEQAMAPPKNPIAQTTGCDDPRDEAPEICPPALAIRYSRHIAPLPVDHHAPHHQLAEFCHRRAWRTE